MKDMGFRNYSFIQSSFLVLLRLLIGWHFLYEGIVKLWSSNWSAGGYLADSGGVFKDFFFWMAGNDQILAIVDFLNIWGLILVGLGLMLGIFTRWATFGGIVLLAFYYLSHPPLINSEYALPSEGSYLIVNKNLIELAALLVLFVFPTGKQVGFDRFFSSKNV